MSGTGSNIELKKENPTDLVTETDKAVEEYIKDVCLKHIPSTSNKCRIIAFSVH